MSTIVTANHRDPEGFEGPVRTAADRFEVREQVRGTDNVVAVHERFPVKRVAEGYAADRAEHEPSMYGPAASHELIVTDTWGWRR